MQVTNLNSNSSYSFRVYAFDEAGNRSNDFVSVTVNTLSPPTTTTTTVPQSTTTSTTTTTVFVETMVPQEVHLL